MTTLKKLEFLWNRLVVCSVDLEPESFMIKSYDSEDRTSSRFSFLAVNISHHVLICKILHHSQRNDTYEVVDFSRCLIPKRPIFYLLRWIYK